LFLPDFFPKIDFFQEQFLPDSEESCVDKPGFGCFHLHECLSKSLRFRLAEVVSGEISSNAVTFPKAPLSVFLPGFYLNTCMIIKVAFVSKFLLNSGSCEPYILRYPFCNGSGQGVYLSPEFRHLPVTSFPVSFLLFPKVQLV
jgi:hypothetical protein